ncbi:Mucosa-associated lymphoid tissue lymphoma translocation protein 1 [Papilio machaon]|uniref:Mucosa-associated lymphoid tissue lymphoma translocation protein 1 n=1 Tax=Papilio machaon TaxID=76193 RepID=A0A0N0PB55_PAPMA|nr:Mucosa-associated lymphoid tissue lymphoma translocation protein 1 [Papilio machaon]
MSLLQTISYAEYQRALALNIESCEILAKLANLKLNFQNSKKPGEILMKTLDRHGYSVQQYRQLLTTALNTKTILTYYRPQSKVAILIGNDKYRQLTKLVTPTIDCDSLASNLKKLGFIIVTLKNLTAAELKSYLTRIFQLIPEDSYTSASFIDAINNNNNPLVLQMSMGVDEHLGVPAAPFIFYAGHGCELCNTRCLLCVDCPTEDISVEHCVTENWLLREVAKCKPELCVLILDMCRNVLDRFTNPKIYTSMTTVEDYTTHCNLLISYSTQSSEVAYELLQIECSTTIDCTYEVKTGDTERIIPGASLYANALCTRLVENLDVSSMLDRVHGDMESCSKRQRPIKVQCGVAKRSLYDPAKGDSQIILNKLKEALEDEKDNCAMATLLAGTPSVEAVSLIPHDLGNKFVDV